MIGNLRNMANDMGGEVNFPSTGHSQVYYIQSSSGAKAERAARPDQQEGRVGQDEGEDGQRQSASPHEVIFSFLSCPVIHSNTYLA